MKKYYSALLLLASLMLWVGCKQGTEGGGSGTGEKVTLQLNIKQGDVFKQLSRTTQAIEQKMMGMSTKINQTNETYLKQEVLAVSPEGVADLRVTYERVTSSTESPQTGLQKYDSQKDTTGDLPAFAIGYGGLVGASFEYSIEKNGTVKEVRGIDSLMNRIFGKAGLGEMGDEIRSSMKEMFGEKSITSMLQGMSAQYPPAQITVGDTWGGENKLGGQFGMIVSNTFKLESIEADKYIVSTTGKISTDSEGGMKVAGIKIDYNMNGESDGSLEIDRKSGMISKSKITQKITGSMTTMGMNVPMSIDQTVEVLPY